MSRRLSAILFERHIDFIAYPEGDALLYATLRHMTLHYTTLQCAALQYVTRAPTAGLVPSSSMRMCIRWYRAKAETVVGPYEAWRVRLLGAVWPA